MAAGWARRVDPTLAQRYYRLMVHEGKHHNSALCHVSAVLLTRIIACWRSGTPSVIRDLDGTPSQRNEVTKSSRSTSAFMKQSVFNAEPSTKERAVE
jgi:hypothetical protein